MRFSINLLGILIVTSICRAGASGEPTDLAKAAQGVRQTIAHRGASADCPENTLAAYRRAIAVGATAGEVDVRTSKDGVLVCLHDADVRRTTNGQGAVRGLTLAELRQLDAGTWFNPKFAGERIPTLREVLELCLGKLDVVIDLKETGAEYAQRIAAEVRKYGDPKRVILGVRNVEDARLFRKLLPEARQLGLIPNPKSIAAFAEAKVEMIRLWPRWLKDESLVSRVRQHGLQLHLNGTTGAADEVAALLQHRPDSLSSDDPARLIRTLAELARSEK